MVKKEKLEYKYQTVMDVFILVCRQFISLGQNKITLTVFLLSCISDLTLLKLCHSLSIYFDGNLSIYTIN